MQQALATSTEDVVDQRTLSKLKWRSRRGLLENDIFIDRFFKRYESVLTVRHAKGLNDLMSLSDADLLDLHLGRKTLAQVDAGLVREDISEVLSMLRANP